MSLAETDADGPTVVTGSNQSGPKRPVAMFRAILPDGDLTAARYEERDFGIELFTEADELLAFVPYSNLVALVNESVEREAERSIM